MLLLYNRQMYAQTHQQHDRAKGWGWKRRKGRKCQLICHSSAPSNMLAPEKALFEASQAP